MESKIALGRALRRARKAKKLTQESFGDQSSRTYISSVERGIYSPTLEKIIQFCEILDIHPVTIMALTCMELNPKLKREALVRLMEQELALIDNQ
jgi:transcriptional regulator with XRE-family HTH domain